MKTITRTKIGLPMAGMILIAALALPAAAQTQVRFKGTFQGNDTVTAPPPTISTTATGIGSLVGQLSFTDVVTLTSASSGTGTGHWVAANGDSLDSTFVASADMSTASLGYITVREIHNITGGTGRFTGAQGSFTVDRIHIEAANSDGTHLTFGSFRGSITSPATAN